MNNAAEQILPDWDRLSPLLDAALERNGRTHSIDDVREMVLADKAQFWPGAEAAAVTEIVFTPQHMTLRVWLAGGDIGELFKMLESAQVYAKSWGCTRMEFIGRPGWEKHYRAKPEWRKVAIVMRQEI